MFIIKINIIKKIDVKNPYKCLYKMSLNKYSKMRSVNNKNEKRKQCRINAWSPYKRDIKQFVRDPKIFYEYKRKTEFLRMLCNCSVEKQTEIIKMLNSAKKKANITLKICSFSKKIEHILRRI